MKAYTLKNYWLELVLGVFLAALVIVGLVLLSGCSKSSPDVSCTRALTAAEIVIDKADQALSAVNDAINGAIAGDATVLYSANATIKYLGETVGNDVDKYMKLAAECRSGS